MAQTNVTYCDPSFQKGAVFISRGHFNPRVLLWFHNNHGFFWTRDNGLTIDGRTCLTKTFVEKAIEPK